MFDLSATARRSTSATSWRKGLAVTAAATLAVAVPALPATAAGTSTEPGSASASVLEGYLGTTPIAGMAWSEASPSTNPGPNRSQLNASAAGAVIRIAGVDVPLSDVIDFGQAGALYSESTATSPWDNHAISGALSSDGSITLDRTDGGFSPVTVDLLSVLRKAGVSGLTNSLVSRADFELGIGGAELTARNGRFLDPDGVGGAGRYRVAQADLDLGSPAIKGAAATLYDAAGRMQAATEDKINSLLDKGAVASRFPTGTTVDARVHADLQDKIFRAILAKPITTRNHIITVDFSTGTMTVHLDQALHGQETVDGPLLPAQDVRPGDPTGLNSQNPNTELVDDELYPMVAESIHDLMDEVYSIAVGVVLGAVDSSTVDWTATYQPTPTDGAVATWTTNLKGDLSRQACTSTGPQGAAFCEGVGAIEQAYGWSSAFQPIRDYWTADNADQLFRLAVDDIKTGLITVPVRNALAPFFDVLAKVVSLQVNHQDSDTCLRPDGSKGVSKLRVSALSLAVLRSQNVATINLGNAGTKVDACSPEASATVLEIAGGARNLADAAYSEADAPSNPGPNRSGVNASVLGNRTISLGGAQVPLDQVIDFGQLAALLSESTATSPQDARAVTGLVGADGSVSLDNTDGSTPAPASIDMLSIMRKAGMDGVTDLAVDQLLLKLGVSGSELQAVKGQLLDPDGVGGPGRYRIGQADLDMHSPLVASAASSIYDGAGQVDRAVENTLNPLLDLTALTNALPVGTKVTARVRSHMQDSIFKAIVAQPLTTKNHVLTVDFSTGKVTVHLDQALHGEETIDGPLLAPQVNRPGDPTGLNSQNPNTELIDDEIYPMIAETVHDLMEEVYTVVIKAIEGSLASVTVDLTATLEPVPGQSATATWSVNLMGTPTAPTCTAVGITGPLLCKTLAAAITLAGPTVTKLATVLHDYVTSDAGHQVFALAIDDIKTGLITIPIRKALDPVLQIVDKGFSIQVNHQQKGTCADGSTGSMDLSALSVAVLRPQAGPRINFANTRLHLGC
ncbi:choice-of-anchor G family protein [Nocardioides jiangxiensis]|uniref:Choice-of-anchor G family protein n=1 Tax=Nocardioides jiangxiensis TaxID=3064524 RepID=A0ABT9AXE6_9ACTN|nr:choice-of-anchor G family protein [Nocardioides sp. WY-20]MDO7867214.1 choice-of-anchor G family protein [Nocardioides sp. WY-20]